MPPPEGLEEAGACQASAALPSPPSQASDGCLCFARAPGAEAEERSSPIARWAAVHQGRVQAWEGERVEEPSVRDATLVGPGADLAA